jgi:hypothetical protein
MKYTGWAMIVIGVLIGVYALLGVAPSPTGPPADGTVPPQFPLVGMLGPFAVIAVLGGIAMLMFGGKGVIKTRNPAIRN